MKHFHDNYFTAWTGRKVRHREVEQLSEVTQLVSGRSGKPAQAL